MTRVRVRRIPPRARGLDESYAAQLAIPMGGYGVGDDGDAVITVGAVGWSFGSALRKATSIAKHITDDPIVNTMLPPQAKAAIAATRKLATAAKRGRSALKSAWGSLPPGLRKRTKGLANSMLKKLAKKKRRGLPEEQMPELEPEMTPEPAPEMSPIEPDPSEAAMPGDDDYAPEAFDGDDADNGGGES